VFSDDVDDSRSVEDVYVPSEITSVAEDTLVIPAHRFLMMFMLLMRVLVIMSMN